MLEKNGSWRFGKRHGAQGAGLAVEARLQELQTVDEALRRRLAAERFRFGGRAALLKKRPTQVSTRPSRPSMART